MGKTNYVPHILFVTLCLPTRLASNAPISACLFKYRWLHTVCDIYMFCGTQSTYLPIEISTFPPCLYCVLVIQPAGPSAALRISQWPSNPLIVMLFFPLTGTLLKTKGCHFCVRSVGHPPFLHAYACTCMCSCFKHTCHSSQI